MSNLERMMRTKVLAESFKQIHSFADGRMLANGTDKLVGATDCMRMIRQAYFKKLQNGFHRFKEKTGTNT